MDKKKKEITTCYSVIFLVIGGVAGLILRACQILPSGEMAFALPTILLLLVGNVLDIRAASKNTSEKMESKKERNEKS